MATLINNYELYFEWWLEELKSVGLVISYEHEPHTHVVQDAVPIFYKQYFKKKEPLHRNFDLVSPITYTPDYSVVFHEKLLNKLFGYVDMEEKCLVEEEVLDVGNVYQETLFYTTHRAFSNFTIEFDVKAGSKAAQFSAKLGSSRDFPVKRALLLKNKGIIVNKVIPIGTSNCLFAKTFMPKRYRYTDSGTMLRKIKGKYNTLEQFLKEKNLL